MRKKSDLADRLQNHTSSALKGRVSSKYPPEVAGGVFSLFWADLFDTEESTWTLHTISASDTRASLNNDILFMHHFKTRNPLAIACENFTSSPFHFTASLHKEK